jgi:hypothetical protein
VGRCGEHFGRKRKESYYERIKGMETVEIVSDDSEMYLFSGLSGACRGEETEVEKSCANGWHRGLGQEGDGHRPNVESSSGKALALKT